MGKSGRHKKLNRQEKAKTQLKGVKKLLKPQNIVNPTLKVKKIVIREQLADNPEGQVSTRRRQTAQELLSTLHHHNTNLRKDALTGLLELVIDHPIVLKQSLDQIIERVAALTSDLEAVVRKENLKVAEAIFERVEDTEIKAFWNIILTHLKCTLTHLNPTVRYGILPFMQLLICHYPRLVVGSISTVLLSLLGLISSSSNSTSTTLLKVEISEKHGDIQERLRVFALIGSCLELYNDAKISKNNGDVENIYKEFKPVIENSSSRGISIFSNQPSLFFTRNDSEVAVHDDKQVLNYLGLSYPHGFQSLDLFEEQLEMFDNMNFENNDESKYENQAEFWKKFAPACVACLTQSWVEVCPTSTSSITQTKPASNKTKAIKKDSKNKPKAVKVKQGDFTLTKGCDNGFMNLSSGNSSPNLNAGAVDTLKSIVTVMAQLILDHPSKLNMLHLNSLENVIKSVSKSQGIELSKYFFSHLPFIAIHDNNKRMLTTINLQLFLLAANLGLLTSTLREKFRTFISELIDGQSLITEQCDLILRFLCDDMENDLTEEQLISAATLSTNFILSGLSVKEQRRDMCKFLWRVLQLDNKSKEEINLMKRLDWDLLTPRLFDSFSRISNKLVNLLTHIAIRELADVKSHLIRKLEWFKKQLTPASPTGLWNECIRLFWYAGALKEFKKALRKTIPKQLIQPLSLEDYDKMDN